jgi:hypothetical protein
MIAPGAYERVRLGGVCAQPAFLLARNRLTWTAAERRFVLSGECGQGGVCAQPAFLLARNRLTRTAAERGFVLSGECVPGRRLRTAGLLTGSQSPYEDSR